MTSSQGYDENRQGVMGSGKKVLVWGSTDMLVGKVGLDVGAFSLSWKQS